MRNSTSRALKATATVVGVAALGATFAGTAAAATPGLDSNTTPAGGIGAPSTGAPSTDGMLGSSSGSAPGIDNGLATFEMPSMKTPTKGGSGQLPGLSGECANSSKSNRTEGVDQSSLMDSFAKNGLSNHQMSFTQ